MVKNKRGWVRILEVFVSITLVAGVVLISLSNGLPEDSLPGEISIMQNSILTEIRINDTLRTEVLNAPLPSNWSDFDSLELNQTRNKINEEKFSFLDCEAKICGLNDLCKQDSNVTGNVYALSGVISANVDVYSPRQVKLFCWER